MAVIFSHPLENIAIIVSFGPPVYLGAPSSTQIVLCVQEDDRDITSRVVVVVGAHKKVFVMISDRCI